MSSVHLQPYQNEADMGCNDTFSIFLNFMLGKTKHVFIKYYSKENLFHLDCYIAFYNPIDVLL